MIVSFAADSVTAATRICAGATTTRTRRMSVRACRNVILIATSRISPTASGRSSGTPTSPPRYKRPGSGGARSRR
jgi:hypothetical protein